jgi:hypothetical protein
LENQFNKSLFYDSFELLKTVNSNGSELIEGVRTVAVRESGEA